MNPKPKPEKKIKVRKPVNKTSLRNKRKKYAHSLLREIVLLRDGQCVCPPTINGHSSILQAGHLIPGTKGGTYFDLYNVNLQCAACNGRHVRYEKYYVGWFIKTFGQAEYLRLAKDSDEIGLKSYEIEEVIIQLNSILEKMKTTEDWKPWFTQKEILSGAWREW